MNERALTIRQPYPDLVVAGVKPVENRGFRPVSLGPLPARLWIHAGLAFADGWKRVADQARLWHPTHGYAPWVNKDRLGALIGSVLVVDVHHADDCYPWGHRVDACTCAGPFPEVGMSHEPGCGLEPYCSEWAEPDCFHWTLADPEPLPEPIPMRGAQGLWKLDAPVPA